MSTSQHDVTVVGAGLAGVECAFQLAERGLAVRLHEQKPLTRSASGTKRSEMGRSCP